MAELPTSLNDQTRVARRARRNVGGEGALILSAGFAALMVVFFVFAERTFLPVSEVTGIRPTVVWVAISLAVAAIWALVHVKFWRPKVDAAKKVDAALKYQQHDRRRAELDAKLQKMEGVKK